MDKLTVFGLLVGITSILAVQYLESGHLAIMFQASAFIIVFCGTLGAVMVQSPLPVFMMALRMARWIFIPPKADKQEAIRQIITWSVLTRKDGILALEARISQIRDPFLRKGAQLVVDGHSAEKIRNVLEVEIHTWEQTRWQCARVWEAAAGYSPTIGIIGAILGLMHVMQNLADPAKLGAGIAVAFVATIYGVAFANLLFLPIANKIKGLIMQQSSLKEMMIDGLECIVQNENPHLIEMKLQGYIDQELQNHGRPQTKKP